MDLKKLASSISKSAMQSPIESVIRDAGEDGNPEGRALSAGAIANVVRVRRRAV